MKAQEGNSSEERPGKWMSVHLKGEAAALPARLRWRRPPAVSAAQGLIMEAGVALPAQCSVGVPVQACATCSPRL